MGRRQAIAKRIGHLVGIALILLGLLSLAACSDGTPTATTSTPRGWQFRAMDGRFEASRDGKTFAPFWPVGINFSLALPGYTPGEQTATRDQLDRWLAAAALAGANTLRVYTVQQPEFYRALRDWNLTHADRPLLLLQGAYLLGPSEMAGLDGLPDYLHPKLTAWFSDEVERAIDAVHGRLTLPAGGPQHPENYGRATGTFDADVSPWLLGFLLGAELEPAWVDNSVVGHPEPQYRQFTGDYLQVSGVTAIESYVTQCLDHALSYAQLRYSRQYPVGWVMSPPVDPLTHPTEPKPPTSLLDSWPIRLGLIKTQTKAKTGVFAGYHIYPFEPDFALHQPEYTQATDADGPNPLRAYLQALRDADPQLPLLLAETGVPSSQGCGHFAPSGLHQGGLDPWLQAWGDLRLLRTAVDAQWGGAVLTSIVDEWFKRDAVSLRQTVPPERRQLWHNLLSPNGHFGLIGLRAGPATGGHVIDGEDADWQGRTPQLARQTGQMLLAPQGDGHDDARQLLDLTADADAEFLHLRLRVKDLDGDGDGQPDWDRVDYVIGLDTLDPQRGDSRLDPSGLLQMERRAEFQIQVRDAHDVRVLVDRPYDLLGLFYREQAPWQVYRTIANDDGQFELVRTLTNQAYGWTQQVAGKSSTLLLAPSLVQEVGQLPTGDEQKPYQMLSNFWFDTATGVLELRIPWALLNVSDPSQRMVIDDDGQHPLYLGAKPTAGFGLAVAALAQLPDGATAVVDTLPAATALGDGHWRIPAVGMLEYAWPTWTVPQWHEVFKPALAVLRDHLREVVPKTTSLEP